MQENLPDSPLAGVREFQAAEQVGCQNGVGAARHQRTKVAVRETGNPVGRRQDCRRTGLGKVKGHRKEAH